MSQKLKKFHRYLNLYHKLVKMNAEKFVDEQLAEDVVQETFLKMYQRLDYLTDEMVDKWLVVVSGNIAKDYVRKGGQYDSEAVDPEELMIQIEGSVDSAEVIFEKEEKQKAARKLLRTACDLLYERNPDWYDVIIDSYMLGMTSAQIAEVLGTTIGNIDVIRSRARNYLRKKLGPDVYDLF